MKLEKGMTVYRVYYGYGRTGRKITDKYTVSRCTQKSAWITINDSYEQRVKIDTLSDGEVILIGNNNPYSRYSYYVSTPELDNDYAKLILTIKYKKHIEKHIKSKELPFDYLELMYLYSNLSEENKKELIDKLKD